MSQTPGAPVGRFAPSTTGPAHAGTLLSALLCWLDARSREGRVWLRLEDLDPERCRPEHAEALPRDLAWLGLEWDGVCLQSSRRADHEAALDRLASEGRLYPCACSRRQVREAGLPAPDGGFRYPNTCRTRRLPEGGWRASDEPLRVRLTAGEVHVTDESGVALRGDPAQESGDPVVRRRDGAVAYHLASVVDDAALGVTRVVRGRDLAPSTVTQVALGGLLGLPRPAYRHHLLLLEDSGGKLAKLHGSLPIERLRERHDAASLCGALAHAAGLLPGPEPTTPEELLGAFDWERVASVDRVFDVAGVRRSSAAR
ncbi:MAG: glutamate--tRNA ligase family protein [Myxococcota bacterium]|nr:glutamate--tRNA ligase family protein [Myxococcota bacterium]